MSNQDDGENIQDGRPTKGSPLPESEEVAKCSYLAGTQDVKGTQGDKVGKGGYV